MRSALVADAASSGRCQRRRGDRIDGLSKGPGERVCWSGRGGRRPGKRPIRASRR
jgi:hypothetical protein